MATFGLVLLFLLVGGAVAFIAFSGGPGAAREAYLTRGNTFFKIAIPLLYVGLGIAIPAVVIANGEEKEGNTGSLANSVPDGQLENGKELFQNTCATCHSLKAVNAQGVTGPDLDGLGLDDSTDKARDQSQQRVLNAIKNGGTGERRMPANLLQGSNAEAVAAYVTHVAGR
jgi:mono/diheme cytochrome c family protein